MRRLFLALAVMAGLLVPQMVEASIDQYLGRTLIDVRVEVAGQPTEESTVLELIETRVGEPLLMRQVRATIDHLVGLGRFEDVRVYAAANPQGVTLHWLLIPVRHLRSIAVTGQAGMAEKTILSELADRFGAAPSVARVADITATLRSLLADRGYRSAVVRPEVKESELPDRAELVLSIAAGVRTTIGDSKVTGTPLQPPADLLKKLKLETGQPYDGPAITARLTGFEDELRSLGYYEARARETHQFSGDGRLATIAIEVQPGPHVRVVFEGDALPASERQALVPIREERSVDLDLLEDAGRAIEAALRRQGYRAAQATYRREQTGGELLLTFNVSRGPLHRIGTVDVAGHQGLAQADIAPLLQLKTGEPFVEARVGAVATAIGELYRVRGYSQVRVTPAIQVLPSDTRAGVAYRPVDIRFDIVEGAQTTVTAVELRGTSAIEANQLSVLLGLGPGKPFYRPQLAVDRDAIEHEYRSNGYQTVSAAPQLSFEEDARAVTVIWTVREGPQVTVDHILVSGNEHTNPEIIRRELTVQPGSPLSDEAMVESQRKLAVLGLFRRIRITEVPREGAPTRDVLVEVEEADTTTLTYGGGLEVSRRYRPGAEGQPSEERLDVAPRAFVDISRRNLWGKNRSITLFGRASLKARDPATDNPDPTDTGGYGLNDYRAFFSFREPRPFGTPGDAQLLAFVEQGVRTSFNFNRKGVSADYARRLGKAVTVTGRYTFDYTQLFDEKITAQDQLLIDRLFPQVKLSKLFAAVVRDSRDDVLDPQRGAVVGVDGSLAARKLGSEVGFVKTFAQGFIYRKIPGRRVVLAAGARLGLAVGFAQDVPPIYEISSGPLDRKVDAASLPNVVKDLPASERFFAGGDTTVRGFSLDRLGTDETLDPQGFPQGGNGLAVFNLEARAPYWKNLQFVWFSDAGNVFKYAGDIRLNEMRVTSGLGFRYRSPIGPLRVDWGFKISTRLLLTGGREKSNVLHISLGQAF
ncbi:MAG: POTRA domain-containing protein [Vicinamibacterales bacterium]